MNDANNQVHKPSDMSRSDSTFLICLTIIFIATCAGVWLRFETLDDCETFWGGEDSRCSTRKALDRLEAAAAAL